MTDLELFQAFVAPAIFISGAGLLVLSINTRLMGIVTRLRTFLKDRHAAMKVGNRREAHVLQSQIESVEHRAAKIRNAFVFTLLGIMGVMLTCLVLGLSLYVANALVVAVLIFVLSVLSMLFGVLFYLSEVAIGLSSVQEEEKLYELLHTDQFADKEQ
jgi:NhaP-type Na+/H+ or K+/H+ antiporter